MKLLTNYYHSADRLALDGVFAHAQPFDERHNVVREQSVQNVSGGLIWPRSTILVATNSTAKNMELNKNQLNGKLKGTKGHNLPLLRDETQHSSLS